MYYGEKMDVTLYFPPEFLDVMRDRFRDIESKREWDGYIVNVTVRISRIFFAWITAFEGKVKILESNNVREWYRDFIEILYCSVTE